MDYLGQPIDQLNENIMKNINYANYINFLQKYKDPSKTKNGVYEKQYINDLINVNISGKYDDVMYVFSLLQQFPPLHKNDVSNANVILSHNLHTGKKDPVYTVPVDDIHKIAMINKKRYSGSGILPLVHSQGNHYFVLFKSAKSEFYEELGGKLDINIKNDKNILWENAIKEATEESAYLFDFTKIKEPESYVEIESNITNSWYRMYVVYFDLQSIYDVNSLIRSYMGNKSKLNSNNNSFDKSYFETNDISFVAWNELYNITMDKLNESANYVKSFQCKDHNGSIIRVRGRTIKAIFNMRSNSIKLTKIQGKSQQLKQILHNGIQFNTFIL